MFLNFEVNPVLELEPKRGFAIWDSQVKGLKTQG